MNNQIEKIFEWGFLLLLNSPEQLSFGIDNSQWVIGKKFLGVKLIPLGAHYVHYSLKEENYQFKLGFFIFISKNNVIYQQIIIKKWHDKIQDFLNIDDKDQYNFYKQKIENMEFDQFLGSYPLEHLQIWQDSSNYISEKVLDQLNPVQKSLYQVEKEYEDKSQNKEEKLEGFQSIGATIFYTDIPNRKISYGVSPQQLSEMNFDKSSIIQQLLESQYQNDFKLLFGELQYAFIRFLLSEDLTSFEQWKKLFIYLTSSDLLINKNIQMFIDLIPVIFNQIKQFPNDFFICEIFSNNFIKSCLKYFILNGLTNASLPTIYKERIQYLRLMLQKKFGVEIQQNQFSLNNNNEDDDDAPTILQDDDLQFIKFD